MLHIAALPAYQLKKLQQSTGEGSQGPGELLSCSSLPLHQAAVATGADWLWFSYLLRGEGGGVEILKSINVKETLV